MESHKALVVADGAQRRRIQPMGFDFGQVTLDVASRRQLFSFDYR